MGLKEPERSAQELGVRPGERCNLHLHRELRGLGRRVTIPSRVGQGQGRGSGSEHRMLNLVAQGDKKAKGSRVHRCERRLLSGPGPCPERLTPRCCCGTLGAGSEVLPLGYLHEAESPSKRGRTDARRQALNSTCHTQQTQCFSSQTLSTACDNEYIYFSLSSNPAPTAHSQRTTFFPIWRKLKPSDENPGSTSRGPSLPSHQREPPLSCLPTEFTAHPQSHCPLPLRLF